MKPTQNECIDAMRLVMAYAARGLISNELGKHVTLQQIADTLQKLVNADAEAHKQEAAGFPLYPHTIAKAERE